MEEYVKTLSLAFTLILTIATVVAARWKVGEITHKRLEGALREWKDYSEGRDQLLASLRTDLTALQEGMAETRRELGRAEAKVNGLIRECHERDLHIRTLTALLKENKIRVPPKEYEA